MVSLFKNLKATSKDPLASSPRSSVSLFITQDDNVTLVFIETVKFNAR